MRWSVENHEEFDLEYRDLPESVRIALLAHADLLRTFGPTLGRPYVDTLSGSKHKNMKELRFDADGGVWRVAFAFDPRRHAILLIAGDKAGVAQKRFYKAMIAKADSRYTGHIDALGGKE